MTGLDHTLTGFPEATQGPEDSQTNQNISRREFLAGAATLLAAGTAEAAAPQPKARAFTLSSVRILHPELVKWQELNRAYLHMLDAERLLHTFRLNAGFPSPAQPLGGWEAPGVEIRGHFLGHYLSACALMCQSAGDAALKEKAGYIVHELVKCQQKLGRGYLSAFPEEFFDRLRDGRRVWVPFYTLHKILAGLIDVYRLCDNREALAAAEGIGQWTARWTAALPREQMQKVLDVEFGGMNEALFDLYGLTRNEDYAAAARRFDHARIFDPLAEGRDALTGLHCNTQIPKVIGAARAFEITGEERYRKIAEFFWRQVTGYRCYCTGGTSNREHWRTPPGRLASELSDATQECCCTYNLLRLTRKLFSWTADPRCADYYERAFWNGIAGTMCPEDGMTMYFVPLASGYWKLYAWPYDSFWCCTGSGTESFSKLADSIYFHDDNGIWVNLYLSSEVDWKQKGVRLSQQTGFPEESTARFTVQTPQSGAQFQLRFRVPHWTRSFRVLLNGKDLPGKPASPGYFVSERRWRTGDVVEVRFPMHVRAEAMPDDPGLQAFFYGPLVLAGDLGREGLTPESHRGDKVRNGREHYLRGKPVPAPDLKAIGNPEKWILHETGPTLGFRMEGQAAGIRLLPFYRIDWQRYAVYWRVVPA